MTHVPINPELLRWARERCGKEHEHFPPSFKKLPQWEDGKLEPTLRQVEAFARAVHVPVGYLFLKEPPEELVPIPDFRTFAGTASDASEPESLGHDLPLPRTPELVP